MADVVDYNQRLTACSRSRAWTCASCILDQLPHGLQVSLVSFNAALPSFAGSPWSKALCLHNQVRQQSVKQDIITVNSAAQALVDQWQLACQVVLSASKLAVSPSQTSFGVLINSHKCCQQWEHAIGILDRMQRLVLRINEITCSSAVHACSTEWETALALIGTMSIESTRPNLVCVSSLGTALDRRATWEGAVSLVHQSVARGMQLNTFLHNTACSACSKVACWEFASCLQADGGATVSQMDVVGITSVIASIDATSWQQALTLLGKLSETQIKANSLAFNAASDSLLKSAQWHFAASLLDRMHSFRMEMDAFAYSMVWTSHRHAGRSTVDLLYSRPDNFMLNKVVLSNAITLHSDLHQWSSALAMLEYMSVATAQPDLVSHSDAISACCVPRWQAGLRLWQQMLHRRVEADAACAAQVFEAAMQHYAICAPELAEAANRIATSQYLTAHKRLNQSCTAVLQHQKNKGSKVKAELSDGFWQVRIRWSS